MLRSDAADEKSSSNAICSTDLAGSSSICAASVRRHQAIIALGSAVKRQALVMGFSDTFAVLGVVLVLAAIAVVLTRKVKGAGGAGAH